MSYLCPFFFLYRIPHLHLQLPLDHCRFILVVCVLTSGRPPPDSFPMAPSSTTPVLPCLNDLLIAIWKGTHLSRNPYPIYHFLTYHHLSSLYSAFISTLSSISLPKFVQEALSHLSWKQAMVKEMIALHFTNTWDLVPLHVGKFPVGYRWVYTVKIR